MARCTPAVLVVLAIVLPALCTANDPIGEWQTGIATFYGGAPDGMSPDQPSYGTLEGACGWGKLDKGAWPYWSVGALATANPISIAGPSYGCGMCFEVQCQQDSGNEAFKGRCNANPDQRSIVFQVTDVCPECDTHHIDLQALTFAKIAPMGNGRVNIKYRQVECTPPQPIAVQIDANNGAGSWIRLLVSRVGGIGSIKTVQMRGAGGDWIGMQNKFGAAWELPVQPQYPLDLRVMAKNGEELTALGFLNENGKTGTIPTGLQFSFGQSAKRSDQSVYVPLEVKSVTTQTPGSQNQGSNGSCGDCTDVAPDSSWTCQQQKEFGKCTEWWMKSKDKTPHGYCAKTCGQCKPCNTRRMLRDADA